MKKTLTIIALVLLIIILIIILTNAIVIADLTPEWLSGLGLIFGFGLLIATLIYVKKTGEMVNEMKRQREILEEPAVSIRILPDRRNVSLLNIILKNTGGGPAYDVSVEFEPDLPYMSSSLNRLTIFNKMAMIEKGESVEFFFDAAPEYFKSEKPKQTIAHLQYYKNLQTGSDNSSLIKRDIKINLEERRGQLQAATKGIHELVNEVQELTRAMLLAVALRDENNEE